MIRMQLIQIKTDLKQDEICIYGLEGKKIFEECVIHCGGAAKEPL